VGGSAESGVTGEQHEHPAIRREGQISHYLHYGRAVARLVFARFRQVIGNPKDTLRGIIERRCKDLSDGDGGRLTAETETGLQKPELSCRREGSAGKHHRLQPVE
jgi:hypothetical protein